MLKLKNKEGFKNSNQNKKLQKKIKRLSKNKNSMLANFMLQHKNFIDEYRDDIVNISDLETNFKLKMGYSFDNPIFNQVVIEIEKAIHLNLEIFLKSLDLYITYKTEEGFLIPILDTKSNLSFQQVHIKEKSVAHAYDGLIKFISLILQNGFPINFFDKFILMKDGERVFRIGISNEALKLDVKG